MEAIFGKQGYRLIGKILEKKRRGEPVSEMEEMLSEVMDDHPEFAPFWGKGEEMAYPQEVDGNIVNPLVHTGLHLVLERQIKEDDPEEVRRVLAHFQSEGRSRHEALHSVAQIWGDLYFRSVRRGNPMEELTYIEALRELLP
jgi:hypothetical protein